MAFFYLKELKAGLIFKLEKEISIFSNNQLYLLNDDKFDTIVDDGFQTKHAALIKSKNKENHQLVDLCSCETLLLRSAKNNRPGYVLELETLKNYELHQGDRILIGNCDFEYCCEVKEEEIEPTGEEETSNKLEIYCEGSEEMTEVVAPIRPEDEVEIPCTQDILSQDILDECDDNNDNKPIMKKQSFEGVNDNVKKEEIKSESTDDDNQVEIADLNTQPVFHIPPATRRFTRRQHEIKKSLATRSMDEFELSQANYENYSLQTQAFKFKTLKPLEIKAPPNIFVHRGQPKVVTRKLNSILLSSSEDEEDVEIKKLAIKERTPTKKLKILIDDPRTPEQLPKMPSQSLINTDFLERVNSSQPNYDNTVVEFKQEDEEDEPLTKKDSLKRYAVTPTLARKKRFKKIMKYDLSDEEY